MRCFNPLCIGSLSITKLKVTITITLKRNTGFNPLCIGSLSITRRSLFAHLCLSLLALFQSPLYRVSLYHGEAPLALERDWGERSFNPLCIGSLSITLLWPARLLKFGRNGFNPLCIGSLSITNAYDLGSSTLKFRSFNPLCIGSLSITGKADSG